LRFYFLRAGFRSVINLRTREPNYLDAFSLEASVPASIFRSLGLGSFVKVMPVTFNHKDAIVSLKSGFE